MRISLPAAAGAALVLAAPLLFTEPASDKLPTLGALPLPSSFPAGAGVEVEVSGSVSGSGAGAALEAWAAAASSASTCLDFAKSLSNCSLYLSAAGDVYCITDFGLGLTILHCLLCSLEKKHLITSSL